MHSLHSFSQKARSLRISAILLAVVCFATPLHTVRAADALTTAASAVTGSSSTRTSLLKSLFGSKSSSDSSSTSGSSQVSRSILGLPIGILKTVASTVSKAAGSVVTKHITHN